MLKIRLARYGRQKRPFYRIIVADVKCPRDGKFVEQIGFYDPINPHKLFISHKRLTYWKQCGAQINKSIIYIIKKFKASA